LTNGEGISGWAWHVEVAYLSRRQSNNAGTFRFKTKSWRNLRATKPFESSSMRRIFIILSFEPEKPRHRHLHPTTETFEKNWPGMCSAPTGNSGQKAKASTRKPRQVLRERGNHQRFQRRTLASVKKREVILLRRRSAKSTRRRSVRFRVNRPDHGKYHVVKGQERATARKKRRPLQVRFIKA